MKDQKKDLLWRAYLLYFGVMLFAITVIGKIVYIQFAEGDIWKEKARKIALRYVNTDVNRGNIYTEDGILLVTSIPLFELRMDVSEALIPEEVFDAKVDSLAIKLAHFFKDKSVEEYRRSLINARKRNRKYHLLKKDVTYRQLKVVRTFPIINRGKFKGGLIEVISNKRYMPYKTMASKTIGFYNEQSKEKQKIVGIEGYYNKQLQGITGKMLIGKMDGENWRPISNSIEIESQDGNDVITTLDLNFQDAAEDALRKQLTKHNADHGCVVLMEVETGKIKAITNLTRFKDGSYAEELNHAIVEREEPGSTFKLATLMVALEDGVIDINDKIETGAGVYTFAGRQMKDHDKGGYGTITVKEVFEKSSNIGVARIIHSAYKDNPERFVERLKQTGIGSATGIEIDREPKALINDPSKSTWSKLSLPWMSIGYEVALTPLQTLVFYNAVANGGKMIRPIFVKSINQAGRPIEEFETTVLNNAICSKSTLDKVKIMLEAVVDSGTAKGIKSDLYKIAGKTGTAQIANRKEGYNKTNYKASFVGYFPADKPKYSCIVVINGAKGGVIYGSQLAAPVFKEIADKVYASQLAMHPSIQRVKHGSYPLATTADIYQLRTMYRGLALAFQTDIDSLYDYSSWGTPHIAFSADSLPVVSVVQRNFSPTTVPDVRGMRSRDAVYLLENMGLEVIVQGAGVVRAQSVKVGTPIVSTSKKPKIVLTLS